MASKFLAQHLHPWLLHFQKRVEEASRHPLFPVLTSLLLEVIQTDLASQEAGGHPWRDKGAL